MEEEKEGGILKGRTESVGMWKMNWRSGGKRVCVISDSWEMANNYGLGKRKKYSPLINKFTLLHLLSQIAMLLIRILDVNIYMQLFTSAHHLSTLKTSNLYTYTYLPKWSSRTWGNTVSFFLNARRREFSTHAPGSSAHRTVSRPSHMRTKAGGRKALQEFLLIGSKERLSWSNTNRGFYSVPQ